MTNERTLLRFAGAALLVGSAVACSSAAPAETDDEEVVAPNTASAEPSMTMPKTDASAAPITTKDVAAEASLDGAPPPVASEPCAQLGERRACTTSGASACSGLQRCVGTTGAGGIATTVWDACECGLVEVAVDTADCATIECPAATPRIVGCTLTLEGGDAKGCVARTSSASKIFVKEGDGCDQGKVAGKVYCAPETSAPVVLDSSSCPINKPDARYVSSPGQCPN